MEEISRKEIARRSAGIAGIRIVYIKVYCHRNTERSSPAEIAVSAAGNICIYFTCGRCASACRIIPPLQSQYPSVKINLAV